jgi:hypothetical protein
MRFSLTIRRPTSCLLAVRDDAPDTLESLKQCSGAAVFQVYVARPDYQSASRELAVLKAQP